MAATVRFAHADVRLPALFSDGMVLQRERPIPVWGWAPPGERVTVRLGSEQAATVADAAGRWRVQLAARPAGGPLRMTVEGSNRLEIGDILIGEVWLASGQSNMQMRMKGLRGIDHEIAAAGHPTIRVFTVAYQEAAEPRADVEGAWIAADPRSVLDFSAVAYFFARDLERALGVPIGILNSSHGGSMAEFWIPADTLSEAPELGVVWQRFREALAVYPTRAALALPESRERLRIAKEKFVREQAAWEAELVRANDAGRDPPRKPTLAFDPSYTNRPAGLFNGMIAPLVPYAVRGAVYYQGEANAHHASEYRALLSALVRSWRRAWGSDLPFLYAQTHNYRQPKPNLFQSDLAELREAQLRTRDLPGTGMAVTIDLGEVDIHPNNKWEVGRRLSLVARARVYGQEVPWSGPVWRSMARDGRRLRLRFDHAEGGLTTRGGEPVAGFAVAGAERRFVPARAEIHGAEVRVWSDTLGDPVAVRYGWGDNPACNLYNRSGLPASPFRTDDWPGVTRRGMGQEPGGTAVARLGRHGDDPYTCRDHDILDGLIMIVISWGS